jgi:transcriptional regulator with XRE-family HTH domain
VFAGMKGRKRLASNLKALRAERRMSQEDLADRADIDRTYVSALERCLYSVSIDVMERLADALGVDIEVLLKEPH